MKQKNIIIAVVIILAVAIGAYLLSAQNSNEPASYSSVKGTITYLPKVVLPSGSIVEVKLQDTSKADAPAVVIASQTITTNGENVPIPFELAYDASQIDERYSYSVSARITINGKLEWINTTNIPVITNGSPTSNVEVMVSQVPASDQSSETTTTNPIIGTKWAWTSTKYPNKAELKAPAGEKYVLSFNADKTVGSTTDCNGLGGNYSVDGEVLSFSQFISTLRFCEGSVEPEYSKDLQITTSYVIKGDQLQINLNRDYGTMYFMKK